MWFPPQNEDEGEDLNSQVHESSTQWLTLKSALVPPKTPPIVNQQIQISNKFRHPSLSLISTTPPPYLRWDLQSKAHRAHLSKWRFFRPLEIVPRVHLIPISTIPISKGPRKPISSHRSNPASGISYLHHLLLILWMRVQESTWQISTRS